MVALKEKEIGEKTYKPGDTISHTDLPGERNPLPKLEKGLKWRVCKRRKDTGDAIGYVVYDLNAPQPTFNELPPTDRPLFKTKAEADKYRANHLQEKIDNDPTSVWRWTDGDKD